MSAQNEQYITALKKVFSNLNEKEMVSAYCISSLIRGDFVQEKSDIDLLLIFKKGTDMEKMTKAVAVIRESFSHDFENLIRGLDILYIREDDIPENEKGSLETNFPALGLFAFDMKEHNNLIFGENILTKLNVIEPKKLAKKQISRWLEKAKQNTSNSTLYAGQILRAIALDKGLTTLNKKVVRDFIQNSDLPDWIKEYNNSHYKKCYEENPLESINSEEFIEKVEAYIK